MTEPDGDHTSGEERVHVEWVCPDCGKTHTKNNPPCSNCGSMQLETRRYRTSETDSGETGRRTSFRRTLLKTGIAVVGLGAVATVGGLIPDFGTLTENRDNALQDPSDPPYIIQANLVSSYEDWGDVEANKIEVESLGDVLNVGFRYAIDVHDAKVAMFEQVRIEDENGTNIDLGTHESEQLVEDDDQYLFEHALSFDTYSWERGTYTATVQIRDNETGETTDPTSFEFVLK
jgi:hypothetical protein